MEKKYGIGWIWGRDYLYVATVVPYKEDSFEVDYDAFCKQIRYFLQPKFVDAGGAIIVNPEAGEVFYLEAEEKKKIIEIALNEVGGKFPVFTGVSHVTTEGTVKEAVTAKDLGVDGIFFVPPMGSGDVTYAWNSELYPEVWIDMMKAIADTTDLPMMVHPTSGFHPRYGVGLPVGPTLKICQEVRHIIGWKMTYNYTGWKTVTEALRTLKHHVGVLGAPGDLYHWALLNKYFDGTVNGAYVYAMEPMIDHIEAWRNNDLIEARRIWENGLGKLQDFVYGDYARLHIRYKIGAWLRGLVPHPFMRPPQPKPMIAECKEMAKLLKDCAVEVILDNQIEKVTAKLPR
ncbi:MAG: dihydrodipicolinate synthase family protein [Syntrophomonadaceae bacterium]|nr:dihydrodipicolinate synthase family protein [Syntrophomonadaceae bacterium]